MQARNVLLDWTKLLLAIAVVATHTGPLSGAAPLTMYFFCNGAYRIAVPTFFVVGGFYLYPVFLKPDKFRKWCVRLFGLYAIWMIFYLPEYLPHSMDRPGIVAMLWFVLFGWHHLWYLLAALLAGLLLNQARRLPVTLLAALALVLMIGGVAIEHGLRSHNPLLFAVVPTWFRHDLLYRNFIFLGFPYICFGYILAKTDFAAHISKRVALQIFLSGIALLELEAWSNYLQFGLSSGFDAFLAMPLCAVGLFILTQKFQVAGRLPWLAQLSTVVYLLHPLIYLNLVRHGITAGTLVFLITILACLVLAPLVLRLARRFPVIV